MVPYPLANRLRCCWSTVHIFQWADTFCNLKSEKIERNFFGWFHYYQLVVASLFYFWVSMTFSKTFSEMFSSWFGRGSILRISICTNLKHFQNSYKHHPFDILLPRGIVPKAHWVQSNHHSVNSKGKKHSTSVSWQSENMLNRTLQSISTTFLAWVTLLIPLKKKEQISCENCK